MNVLPQGTDCCNPCSDIATTQVPGPRGDNGTNGNDGTNGKNAYDAITHEFTMPALDGTVTPVGLSSTAWLSVGQTVFIAFAGYMLVTAIPSGTEVTLKNESKYSDVNAAPGTIIPLGASVSSAGIRGMAGTSGLGTLNSISPTTTKGDLLVDNGANSPNASIVRLGAATNGKAVVYDSTQPTGVKGTVITPNSVANDNNIPRFDGVAGTPMPLQDSKLLITDDGALQSTPTGGNARGSKAVDLQVDRTLAASVASGVNSVIGGGSDNKASAANSTVGGGLTNSATGSASVVAGGNTNTASNSSAFVGGGANNTASGVAATVGAGGQNTASGGSAVVGAGLGNIASADYSCIPGGAYATTDKYGQVGHASGRFASNGDAQTSELIWRITTTDGTVGVEMFLDGSGARATVPANTSWGFHLFVVGRDINGPDAMWEVKGLIHKNFGATAMACAASISVICDGTGSTWGVVGSLAVTADNPNSSLKLAVTGLIAKTIRWCAWGRLVEVNH